VIEAPEYPLLAYYSKPARREARSLLRSSFLWALYLCAVQSVSAGSLTAERLGVIFNASDPVSVRLAQYYSQRRHVPPGNLVGLIVPDRSFIGRDELMKLRGLALARLPSDVQSLLLVWSKPYAVECMSITTAFAAGYDSRFCEPGCRPTMPSPLFDSAGWLPADTAGWLPAMLLPSQDEPLAKAVIDRGVAADSTHPVGTVYLVRTRDSARNVRADGYPGAVALLTARISVRETAPLEIPTADIIGYFTGAVQVPELTLLTFRPGAVADHLTSSGGVPNGQGQMSSLEWIRQGATASYGSVSEPCNHLGKFPDPAILFAHYLRGETLLEAYWKSVLMPGQGLFLGEPLARPFGPASHE
jgi:uncharacterized protein (TIGR03790 family)